MSEETKLTEVDKLLNKVKIIIKYKYEVNLAILVW